MPQTKEELISKIKNEIPYIDVKPYSHNIISLTLQMLYEGYGQEEVNNLVKTTELKNKGWGHLINEKEKERKKEREEKLYDNEFLLAVDKLRTPFNPFNLD